jgi:hypothetical protein
VAVASHGVLKEACLTQALGAQVLIAQHSYPTCLRLGVACNESGQFQAHTWVKYKTGLAQGPHL